MEHSTLAELTDGLEYGTKAHISFVFLTNYGNYMKELPIKRVKHAKPFCDCMKATPEGFTRCFKCRNTALKKAAAGQKPFGGFCFNGIYEYCYPVVVDGTTVAVIFVGNILPAELEPPSEEAVQLLNTFDRKLTEERCSWICLLLDRHIRLLLREYSGQKPEFDPLMTNICNYIEESLYCDISVKQLAAVFGYSGKYLGKLFKKQMGKTVKEYINKKRLQKAEELLKKTDMPVANISARTGFNNVTYFNRLFKAAYGMPPREYRK